ncbi:MAG TPA: hypothetical protein DIC18_03355 [Clostridiales bacterium]|nr:hypothetical protein [Clostridiales bacterium]
MFGCCNSLFSSSCRCRRCNGCGNSCGGITPMPIPVPTPIPTPPSPTPIPRLRGLEATLTAGSGGTVANGFPIPFNNLVSNNAIGANFVTGAVTLTRPGTYLVNWWVATDIDEPNAATKDQAATVRQAGRQISFSVALNGSIVSGSYAPCWAGQVNGSSLVTVQSTPATLQIVNSSGQNVLLAQTTAQAGMTITQLA